MPQGPLQIWKGAISCRSANKPASDAVEHPTREATPRPGPGRGARPLFSLPLNPPRAFYTRRWDRAIERLESSKRAESRKPKTGPKVTHGKNNVLSSARQQSLSAHDVDAADDVVFAEGNDILVVDEANLQSNRAQHNGDIVPKINNAVSQDGDEDNRIWHHTLKHKNKQVPLRSEFLNGDDRTSSLACSSQNRPRRASIPSDLTFGILGPPAYKPPNRSDEVSAPNDPFHGFAKEGKVRLRTKKQPSEDPFHSRCQHEPPQSKVCTSRMCPVLGPHSLGLYLHNKASRTRPETYFGDSNPPPIVWSAVDLMSEGKANQMDAEMIAEFMRLHYCVVRKTR